MGTDIIQYQFHNPHRATRTDREFSTHFNSHSFDTEHWYVRAPLTLFENLESSNCIGNEGMTLIFHVPAFGEDE